MELCEQSMQVLDASTEIKPVPVVEITPEIITNIPKIPQKRKMLTIAEKMDIINAIKSGTTNVNICKQKHLPSSSVSSIWKSRETIIAAFESNKAKAKRLRLSDKSDLEELLATWTRNQTKQNSTVTRSMVKEKATEFAKKLGYTNYICNNSWLDRFKTRNNISYGKTIERKKYKHLTVNSDERWITNSLNNDEIINNNNVKSEPDVNLTQSLIEDKIVTNEEVQSALHTLLLFYKTNDVSSEFQNSLTHIKRIVDDYFSKKE